MPFDDWPEHFAERAAERERRHRAIRYDRKCPDCDAPIRYIETRIHWTTPIEIFVCTDCGQRCFDAGIVGTR